jgi:hypothetical protein
VSHVRYELGFYIPEDGIFHSHRRENLKSYRLQRVFPQRLTGWSSFSLGLTSPCRDHTFLHMLAGPQRIVPSIRAAVRACLSVCPLRLEKQSPNNFLHFSGLHNCPVLVTACGVSTGH